MQYRQQDDPERGRSRWPFSWPTASLIDILLFAGLVVIIFLFFRHSQAEVPYHWQWYQVPRYLWTIEEGLFRAGPLLTGLALTIKISAVSLILAFIIGMLTAMLRLSRSFVGRAVARLYLEISRNTPLLIQIFFIYFVMGPILGLDRFWAAVLALSLYEGAYASEIFRSGIVSIERCQWEAAASIGLNRVQVYRLVILPQAVRRTLPPLAGQAVSLIKDSALVSTIAIYDLTMQAQAVISETFLTFELWLTVAGMYLVLTASLSLLVGGLERRLRVD
ncbi:MAG: amino acid ABC transporter permease [Desulfobulbaceae bacterium]|uniref:Putative glutamine transport system permease protein GlnP n=1 Tax=Candidatus Desulfatifera sulfidica TaxID=2841691 RepID=A0A8J6N8N2_9BACT|nr:amino acid ABC transporter permease [Candidatus Desulfatifera sulfidica]